MTTFTCFLVLSILVTSALADSPAVKLGAGTVRGTTCPKSSVSLYQGIPFAEPPIGKLRFMPPQPLNGSYKNGVLDATSPPPTCIQMPSEFAWTEPSTSEDCLYLDVYVPDNVTGDSKLHVKVFAYGGGNIGGAVTYPLYNLCNLATDVIAVSFNYRLGPLGFLGLKSAGIEGNMAIKDYVAALEWVQENIEDFGGDPKKVMLFGQSAGADNTFVVSTLPSAKSLISSAICESGGGEDLSPYEVAQEVGASYARTLGCSPSDLQCLQSKPVKDLIEAFEKAPALSQGIGKLSNPALSSLEIIFPRSTTFGEAFVDGDFIAQQPLEVGSQVPMVFGSNVDDGTLFTVPPLLESGYAVIKDNYTEFLTQFGSQASKVEQEYPLSAFNSTGSTEARVIEAITTIYTLATYTCFTHRALRAAVNAGTPAYAYSFNHTPSCPWLWFDNTAFPSRKLAPVFGAAHTAELPFVFGNVDQMPWGNGTCDLDPSEDRLSETMRKAWTSMAETGSPSSEGLEWRAFDECESQGVYIKDVATPTRLDYSECAFWDDVWVALGGVDVGKGRKNDCQAKFCSSLDGGIADRTQFSRILSQLSFDK